MFKTVRAPLTHRRKKFGLQKGSPAIEASLSGRAAPVKLKSDDNSNNHNDNHNDNNKYNKS